MPDLKKCLLRGLQALEPYIDELNAMNVFPIADKDTGRNLYKTLEAVKTMEPKDISSELLMAARGNSGNMLALFFRNWPVELDSVSELYDSLIKAKQDLEMFIPNLVHGTIYDVMIGWSVNSQDNLKSFFKAWLENAEQKILAGPDNLAVLDMYGTLDSGAVGLYYILAGIAAELGLEYPVKHFYVERAQKPWSLTDSRYCVEALVKTESGQSSLQKYFRDQGDSLILVKFNDSVKLHIHCKDFNQIRQLCESIGQIQDWKVDDMEKASD